jgi:hypothetical protein
MNNNNSILFPDGVGIRNYLYSDVLKEWKRTWFYSMLLMLTALAVQEITKLKTHSASQVQGSVEEVLPRIDLFDAIKTQLN